MLLLDRNGQAGRPPFVGRHQEETTESNGQQTIARKVWDPDKKEGRWPGVIVKLRNRTNVRAFRTDLVTI